jgi:plasmid maintenance system killer protein
MMEDREPNYKAQHSTSLFIQLTIIREAAESMAMK